MMAMSASAMKSGISASAAKNSVSGGRRRRRVTPPVIASPSATTITPARTDVSGFTRIANITSTPSAAPTTIASPTQ